MQDHSATSLLSDRTCDLCGRTYTPRQRRAVPGWEPIKDGWSCPTCSRRRHRELREKALAVIGATTPRWHALAYSGTDVDPDVLDAARAILLSNGALTPAEAAALRDAILSR